MCSRAHKSNIILTRQRESFLVLLSNMNKANKLRDIAANSGGAAEAKYNAYLDSYEASQKGLQNAWQDLGLKLEESGILTSINKGLTKIVEYLPQIITVLGTQLMGMKFSNILYGGLGSGGSKGGGIFGGLFSDKRPDGLIKKGLNYVTGEKSSGLGMITAKVTGISSVLNNIYTYLTTGKATGTGQTGTTGDNTTGEGETGAEGTGTTGGKQKGSWKKGYGKQAAIGAAIGVAQGITSGISTGAGLKNSDGEEASDDAKLAGGLATGGVTAAATIGLSLIPYVGPILGPTLGPVIGQAFGTYVAPLLGNMIDQTAILRRERSKDAEKSFQSLKSIEGDTSTLKDLAKEDSWSFSQYQQASTAVDNIVTQLYGNTKAGRIMYEYMGLDKELGSSSSYSDAKLVDIIKNKLYTDYLGGNSESRESLMNLWEAALYQAEASTFAASKENELFKQRQIRGTHTVGNAVFNIGSDARDAIKEFAEANGGLELTDKKTVEFKGMAEERLETEKQLLEYLEDQGLEADSFYKKLQKNIVDLTGAITNLDSTVEEMNKYETSAAGIVSLQGKSTAQLKTLGIDEIARLMIEELNEDKNGNPGGLWDENGASKNKVLWTGSLDTLGSRAYNYVNDYIRSNQTLYNIATGGSYSLGEVQRGALQGAQKDSYLRRYAKELNMTIDELQANWEKYSGFTLEDIMKGYEDVKSALETIDGLFSSISSSTGLTADNMKTIISKFPELIGRFSDTQSLVKELYTDMNINMDLQKNNILEMIGSSEDYFDRFKKGVIEQGLITQNEFDTLFNNISSGDSFYDAFLSMTPENKEKFADLETEFKNFYDNIVTDLTIDTTFLDGYRSYLSKLYELQIDNLTKQKNAINDITKQREYENKLIEARIKLENAQNEKKAVYREGVGMVYEADQEAIEEAEEELAQLDAEKMSNDLDMIITELQSQKDWLDQTPDREQFQNLQDTVQGILDALNANSEDTGLGKIYSVSNNLYNSVGDLLKLYQQTTEFTSRGYSAALVKGHEEQVEEAENNFEEAYLNFEGLKGIQEQINQTRLGNQSYAGLQSYLTDLSKNGATDTIRTTAASILEEGVGNASQLRDRSAALINTIQKQAGMANQQAKTLSGYGKTGSHILSNGQTINLDDFSNMNVTTDENGNIIAEKGGIFDWMQNYGEEKPKLASTEIEAEKQNAIQGIEKILRDQYGFKTLEEWYGGNVEVAKKKIKDYFDQDIATYQRHITDLGTGRLQDRGQYRHPKTYQSISGVEYYQYFIDQLIAERDAEIATMDKQKGYLFTKNSDLTWRAIREAIASYLEGANYQVSDTIYGKYHGLLDNYKSDYDNMWVDINNLKSIYGMKGNYDYIMTDQLETVIRKIFNNQDIVPIATTQSELSGFALGSLHTSSGLSTISEVGPELFATPGLSGTAIIPEGSKVIPAEATKGLWQLGSFASQFIRPLQSVMNAYGAGGNYSTSKDESVNINNLVMNLQANKDFDIDAFVQQLKLLQAISKHNN